MAKHLGTFAVGLDGKEDPLLITDCDSHYTYIGDKELLDYIYLFTDKEDYLNRMYYKRRQGWGKVIVI